MATHTDLEQGVNIWQEIAEILIHIRRTEGDTNRDDLRIWNAASYCNNRGHMPKAFKNKYRGLHKFRREHMIKLCMAVEKLRKEHSECFYQPKVGPHHNQVMDDIRFILVAMEHPKDPKYNVLDAHKKYNLIYNGRRMKSHYWNFVQLLADVWWGIEDESIRTNPSKMTKTKTPNKNHREPTQSPAPQFHRLFDIKHQPKGEQ